ncbi:hypothetical protein K505DRAFT_421450 [Melanomma pulvis-pyrius CBS 109.77]|uniref:Uncharacterized protein n=1 Tax=Melanomma pulvis-pyrius CBS 109.77 TaxID=1314802 RepID=A0A6A6WUN8_9PLEO|nr:hypothetical protein K505DRAFT_421450 [Melanomma pulvis-pyrius CBS 109.77]
MQGYQIKGVPVRVRQRAEGPLQAPSVVWFRTQLTEAGGVSRLVLTAGGGYMGKQRQKRSDEQGQGAVGCSRGKGTGSARRTTAPFWQQGYEVPNADGQRCPAASVQRAAASIQRAMLHARRCRRSRRSVARDEFAARKPADADAKAAYAPAGLFGTGAGRATFRNSTRRCDSPAAGQTALRQRTGGPLFLLDRAGGARPELERTRTTVRLTGAGRSLGDGGDLGEGRGRGGARGQTARARARAEDGYTSLYIYVRPCRGEHDAGSALHLAVGRRASVALLVNASGARWARDTAVGVCLPDRGARGLHRTGLTGTHWLAEYRILKAHGPRLKLKAQGHSPLNPPSAASCHCYRYCSAAAAAAAAAAAELSCSALLALPALLSSAPPVALPPCLALRTLSAAFASATFPTQRPRPVHGLPTACPRPVQHPTPAPALMRRCLDRQ